MPELNLKSPSSALDCDALGLPIIALAGPCGTWNAKIADAFGLGVDAVLLLGQGVEQSNQSIDFLLTAHKQYRNAILGGVIADADHPQCVRQAGSWWSNDELEWCHESYLEIVPDPTESPIKPADWLSSSALLVPHEAWLATGGFDPGFGAFLGDADWCLRARADGLQCFLVRDARFLARQSGISAQPSKHERLRSILRLAGKHGVPCGMRRLALRYIWADVTKELNRVAFWTDYGSEIAFPKRLLWYVRNLFQALRREHLQYSIRQIMTAMREASLTNTSEAA